MRTDEARRFIAGKLYSFRCFEGTAGAGRIQHDGSVVGIILVILRLRQLQGKIPYGPYIALAAVIWLFFGPQIIAWYIGMFSPRMP